MTTTGEHLKKLLIVHEVCPPSSDGDSHGMGLVGGLDVAQAEFAHVVDLVVREYSGEVAAHVASEP
jgi:hypothetical protein